MKREVKIEIQIVAYKKDGVLWYCSKKCNYLIKNYCLLFKNDLSMVGKKPKRCNECIEAEIALQEKRFVHKFD